MKPINPSSYKNPPNWREAYAEFQKLTAMAHRVGESTAQWNLEYPSSFREKMSGHWRLTYTLFGKVYTVFVGYNGLSAAEGLRGVYNSYPKHKRHTTEEKKKPTKKSSLLFDHPHEIVRLFREWNAVIGKVGHSMSVAEFEEQFKLHRWMMSRKAGYLDMDMLHYLVSHPHSVYWPSPPKDQREFDERQRRLREIVQQKESRERQNRDFR